MQDHRSSVWGDTSSPQLRPRVAVVGGGIAGLTCARELVTRGCDPVVFEASDRLGGRCSTRSTDVGLFDDAAQCITGATQLAALAVHRPGELAALHPWTIAGTPAEDERNSRTWNKNVDESNITRTLKLMGAVGVPSMVALANAVARPLDVRLHAPILRARRRGKRWILVGPAGEIDENFDALVLAIPAPLAMPLVQASARVADALRAVRYLSRWVLLLGSERPVCLPGYREFEGSPIERVAAMHTKPGRVTVGPQRWFVEAGQRWSTQHEHVDAETVAELLLDNFREHAGRTVMPNFLRAVQWRHAFVQTPAATRGRTESLWDNDARLGVCGDSVVESRVDRVHRSGADMARVVAEACSQRRRQPSLAASKPDVGQVLEAHL
jgi:renalase